MEDFDSRKGEVEGVVARWREAVARVPDEVQKEFQFKLMISLIYHDSALEGNVLTHPEIKAAIDTSIISDSSLIPSYELITNLNASVQLALELGRQETKIPIRVELIRQLYAILNPEGKADNMAYREDAPLHRLYYHSIAAPETVKAEMKKLDEWLVSDEFLSLEPIEKAATAHWKLMAVFPWLKHTGRVSRVLSILILAQEGYPVPVIHSIDRQAYYEALRSKEFKGIHRLYLEAVETTATSSLRVYQEAASYRKGRRAS